MLKLMKLEFAKIKVSSIVRAFVIIAASILAFTILTGSIIDEGERMFDNASQMLAFGEILCRISYGIFGGVMLGNVVIGEYKEGTIQNLFSYPISRKRIMGCKLCIVFGFTFITILLSEIIFGIGMFLANRWITIVTEPITLMQIMGRLPGAVFSAGATAGLSMIPLYFGMRRKSVTATIVAGVVINCLVNSSFGGDQGQLSLFSISLVPAGLCILGLAIASVSYRAFDKRDVI